MGEDRFTPEALLSAKDLEREKYHDSIEIENIYRCGKVERDWLSNPDLPSGYVLTVFHATLLKDVGAYLKKGTLPLQPGRYRLDDIYISREPRNFYAHGLDVKPLMQAYTENLDRILSDLPSLPDFHTEGIVHNAAWAYYTFIRIHPFLDGNGRVGRMVMKRVLSGAGFRDIVFPQQLLKGKKLEENREQHLQAMHHVDETGNLAYLELYIAKLLLSRYSPADASIYSELEELISKKNREVGKQTKKEQLSRIWPQFANIDIYGGGENVEMNELESGGSAFSG